MRSKILLCLAILFSMVSLVFAEARLLRFPHIHNNDVVFVYAGDLWLVSAQGGTARRLTSHEGMELFPRFSPDGQWIAFSAEYSGSRQVYVMPSTGGEPRQLTFYADVGPLPPRGGWDYQIMDWTPDSKKILVRCNRVPYGERLGKYYLVDISGGYEQELVLSEGGLATYSPDGKKIAYNPISREFRTWKRYRGGRAQDIWIYNFAENSSEKIIDTDATDNFPMWVDQDIYFTSDRDNKLNLYKYNTETKDTQKVTDYSEFDVLWPSRGVGGIVYENGGYIYHLDTKTGKSRKIDVSIYDDLPMTRPVYKTVDKWIESFSLSPSAKRALFCARGDVFTIPAENGNVRNITNTQGVRERTPVWSPDGKHIIYQSDASGEYEFYLADPMGKNPPKKLTSGNNVWTFEPVWSPDSRCVAFSDKKMQLGILDISTGKIIVADKASYSIINDINWSPDSRWLTYTKQSENQMNSIWLYDTRNKKIFQLTKDYTQETNPVFDPNGKYLYFISQRDFNLSFSEYEFDYIYDNSNRIFLVTLTKECPNPFEPKSDEENQGKEQDESNTNHNGDIKIDVDGFPDRVVALDISPGGYQALSASTTGPVYLRRHNGKTSLFYYDMENRKEETVMTNINSYRLTFDAQKFIYKNGKSYGIADLKPNQKENGKLATDKLTMHIDPKKEWVQMFTDVYRIFRDWFYDPSLHGVDWEGIKNRYEPLVPYVAHRADLDYIFGEMVGELATGHTYVQPGDQPKVKRIQSGLLGAELQPVSGFYRIEKIFKGENWHKNWRSPLTMPGVKAAVGDYILAVNGNKVTAKDNFYKYTENTLNTIVTLTINNKPSYQGAWDVKFKPIASESDLRYLDWVAKNRDYVDKKTNGRVGYIHLPNTAFEGNKELFRWFYPQAGKDALVIDVRYNGGGFIPERMIELLDRQVVNYWARRGEVITQTPAFVHEGPKVCLINEYSSSGGDAFPYYFRKRGLGPLIGKRTWGGLIGITANPALIDGGSITIPQFSFFDTEGKWAVENIGVAPDMEVENRPEQVVNGLDPQLDKAIEYLLEQLKTVSSKPKIPSYPER